MTYDNYSQEIIPEKSQTTNQYYNFSDSSEEEIEELKTDIVDESYIDNL